MAWILRYRANLLRLSKERKLGKATNVQQQANAIVSISVIEMNNAEREILKQVQKESFEEELLCLNQVEQSAKPISMKKSLKKSSSINKLDPILDSGLIRVGGRLQRAPLDNEAKHPVILPKKHHIV